jgi:hypothetical protein
MPPILHAPPNPAHPIPRAGGGGGGGGWRQRVGCQHAGLRLGGVGLLKLEVIGHVYVYIYIYLSIYIYIHVCTLEELGRVLGLRTMRVSDGL